MEHVQQESDAKIRVALTSVFAALLLTTTKLTVGILTNSLGILAEALHSGLDMVAAIITLLAVYYSKKPADSDHNFGHGKVENFSALIETVLLIITCGWVIWEAIHRFIYHVTPEVNIFSFGVVIFAIIIDYERSRMLFRVAKRTRSQALQADALHFSTDILSSSVVILGLIFVSVGFPLGDALAALGVAIIVIWISLRLGSSTVNALMDKVPAKEFDIINDYCCTEFPAFEIKRLRLRESGPTITGDLTLLTPSNMQVNDFHEVSNIIHKNLVEKIPNLDLMINSCPKEEEMQQTKLINVTNIHKVIDTIKLPGNVRYHTYNISVYKNSITYYLELYLELPNELSLSEAFSLVKHFEDAIKLKIPLVNKVNIHLEPVNGKE